MTDTVQYKIENNSGRDIAVKVYGGTKTVKSGKTEIVDSLGAMAPERIARLKELGCKVQVAKATTEKTEKSEGDDPKLDRKALLAEAEQAGVDVPKGTKTTDLPAMIEAAKTSQDGDEKPDRAALEAKATELEVEFNDETTDEDLAAAVEAADQGGGE